MGADKWRDEKEALHRRVTERWAGSVAVLRCSPICEIREIPGSNCIALAESLSENVSVFSRRKFFGFFGKLWGRSSHYSVIAHDEK
jgi:hypothetical protein